MPLKLPFTKMQALGNDFVLLEEKHLKAPLGIQDLKRIADRRQGVGCDQVILLRSSTQADIELSFYNADGSEALTCGNGTRCVAKYLGKEKGTIQTPSFLSHFSRQKDNITISLNDPVFAPPRPLPSLPFAAHYVNLGNPHLVIFTDSLESLSLEELAPSLQPPEGLNVEAAQITFPTRVKVKVWERGVGITPACGSGACAVGILSLKLGLVKSAPVSIEMEGGSLNVAWQEGSPPLLTGPAEFCFEGTLTLP